MASGVSKSRVPFLRTVGNIGHLALACLAALAVALAASGAARAQSDLPRDYVDLVGRSGFIFQGSVREVGAATKGIRAQPDTVVVTVEAVLQALPPLGDMKGQDVTVRMGGNDKVEPGQAAIFFTYAYSMAATLGLQEVGVRPAGEVSAEIARVRLARSQLRDDALSARLASADLVVLGVLGKSRPTKEAEERDGEHDPIWRQVPIEVAEVLKGERTAAPPRVNIATSDDPAWMNAPKPTAETKGIFLLQPDKDRQFRVAGLFLIDPLDLQPTDQLERVRELLKKQQ
jgi:hypothetical protein